MPPPDLRTAAVLTIAGSDSSGGAGIQADLKTFAAFSVYGASVITALTAQNTHGVQGVEAVTPDFVAAQMRSVLDDLAVRAIKTGMLANTPIIASTIPIDWMRLSFSFKIIQPKIAMNAGEVDTIHAVVVACAVFNPLDCSH